MIINTSDIGTVAASVGLLLLIAFVFISGFKGNSAACKNESHKLGKDDCDFSIKKGNGGSSHSSSSSSSQNNSGS